VVAKSGSCKGPISEKDGEGLDPAIMANKAAGLISAVKGFASKQRWLAAESSEVEVSLESKLRERRYTVDDNLIRKLPG
jgi:hypothetical protein